MIGYTSGMKTAVSIPKEIYEAADRFAKAQKISRSQLYTDALRYYVYRHDPDAITEALNRLADAADTSLDPALRRASRRNAKADPW